MKEVTGSKSEIVFAALPGTTPRFASPTSGCARELIGWEPKVELADGLRMTIEQSGRERLIGDLD